MSHIYTFQKLKDFCKENKITLDNSDYSKIYIFSIIKGKCKNNICENSFCKSFRALINQGGAYCPKCTKENTKEKTKKTFLDNYGVENPFQNKEIQNKIKQTNFKKYGVENPSQNNKICEKRKQTYFEKTGYENAMHNPEAKEKLKQTNLTKYDVEHPMQNKEVQDRASKNAYKAYDYTCPSGKIIRLQGYEKFGYKYLIDHGFDEDDIVTGSKNVPNLTWKDEEGKVHRHFVDFYIKSLNKCIEIKSTWTFEHDKEYILLKQKYAKKTGYKYTIWVFDAKGNRVEKHL